jgi:hypothetical protein
MISDQSGERSFVISSLRKRKRKTAYAMLSAGRESGEGTGIETAGEKKPDRHVSDEVGANGIVKEFG